jgi:hypothetical protein
MQTINEFAEACKTLDSDGIYELFEYCIPQILRDMIYAMAGDCAEPARASLNKLGYMFGVESLINY